MIFSRRDIQALLFSVLVHCLMLALPCSEKLVPVFGAGLPAPLDVILRTHVPSREGSSPTTMAPSEPKRFAIGNKKPLPDDSPPPPALPDVSTPPYSTPPALNSPQNPDESESELLECSDSFGKVLFNIFLSSSGDILSLDGQGENTSTACIERLAREIQAKWSTPEGRTKEQLRIEIDLGPTNQLLPQ